ncbi:TPA: hypothetical protein ACIYKI_005043, partial [Escherichia coli]
MTLSSPSLMPAAVLTSSYHRLRAILTALSATPSNQKTSRLFHAQREKYSHSVVSLRHRSG